MGQGIIIAAVIAMWAVYLATWFFRRREHDSDDQMELSERFSASMTIISRSDPLETPEAAPADPGAEVSTPFTRRAARTEIWLSHRNAARRRRNTLLVLLGLTVLSVVGAVAMPRFVPGWAPFVAGGLLICFIAIARYSTITLRKTLDARLASIDAERDEPTIDLSEVGEQLGSPNSANEVPVELNAPIEPTGSLWDPIAVTPPTYVSRPMVARTVRTIDLSMMPATPPRVPVTAEHPDAPVSDASVPLHTAQLRTGHQDGDQRAAS